MSQVLEWRELLESAHKQLQDAMTDLITNKNYSEAERAYHTVRVKFCIFARSQDLVFVRPQHPHQGEWPRTTAHAQSLRGLCIVFPCTPS